MTSVHLEITNCQDCPFMRPERLYTGDSFELCFDWKCSKKHFAIIASMEWNDKPPPIPAWCPLRKAPAGEGEK